MDIILNNVLKKIKPSKEDELKLKSQINTVISKIKKVLPKCTVILGGSGEKGTWLKGAADADIFVKFPKTYLKKNISDILSKKLSKIFKVSRLHGSRDYFQINIESFTYEVIPIINISKAEDAENITDISPLHAKWVKKHKKYNDEIRLTKQFFKSAKVYGAESYISGFSGYICEIITIHYKGFLNLLKNISKWKQKEIIDTEKFYSNKNRVLFNIDKSKTSGPLVIVDPVQKSRNAAAAVSTEKFIEIVNYADKFLKSPSGSFFDIKKIEKRKFEKKDYTIYSIEITPNKGKKDVVGCKIIKVLNFIKSALEKNDFKLANAFWEWNGKATFYLQIKSKKLNQYYNQKGPPLRIKENVRNFKKKHKKTFQKNKIIYAKVKRKFRNPIDLLRYLITDKYIKEKVKDIKLLK